MDDVRHPGPHRFAVEPIRRSLCYASKKIDHSHLGAEQPQRPGRRSLGTKFRPQPCVDGERAVGRNENQEEPKKAHQVGVVYIPAFIEKKEIAAAEEKKHGANAIEKSGSYKCRQDAEHGPMNVDSIAGPEMNPGKPVVLE